MLFLCLPIVILSFNSLDLQLYNCSTLLHTVPSVGPYSLYKSTSGKIDLCFFITSFATLSPANITLLINFISLLLTKFNIFVYNDGTLKICVTFFTFIIFVKESISNISSCFGIVILPPDINPKNIIPTELSNEYEGKSSMLNSFSL